MSNTPEMSGGAAHGPGIYLAEDSSISMGYAHAAHNPYSASQLGNILQIISLCEVARVPGDQVVLVGGRDVTLHGRLNAGARSIATLTMEEALVVRMMFVFRGDFSGLRADRLAAPVERLKVAVPAAPSVPPA